MTSVTLIDSPFANVANIARALSAAGASVQLTRDGDDVLNATKLVLPGVGSFPAAMAWLEETNLARAIRSAARRGVPLLGICLGHQLLFETSDEMGMTRGLGLVEGTVHKLETALPVPQIGWNRVSFNGSPLFDSLPSGTAFYFVNSFAVSGVKSEIARAEYGPAFTAAIAQGNLYGVQFHPEKSSTAGLQLLANFVRL